MTQTSEPIIVFDHVSKEFRQRGSKQPMRAVDDVSLSIDAGDIFGIIGYSGAGKSTLVRMINALEQPTSGSVTVLGERVSSMSESKLRPVRQKIGMIFQQFNLFSSKTVAQNVAYPLKLDHWRKDYQDKRVAELLEFVGLSDHAGNTPPNSPAARSSASALRARWRRIRRSCSPTRRRVRSTPRRRPRCSICSSA